MALVEAPASNSVSITRSLPERAAAYSGVMPRVLGRSTSAPASSSSLTSEACPESTARQRRRVRSSASTVLPGCASVRCVLSGGRPKCEKSSESSIAHRPTESVVCECWGFVRTYSVISHLLS
eukprot:scaffold27940_cov32-Tisochrysis_lutea.AAC.1